MRWFNFDCYAVLSIDTLDDRPEDEREPEHPELHGFWLGRVEAENAIVDLKAEREAERVAEEERWRTQWGARQKVVYSTLLYVVVPLKEIESNGDLSDLEEDLQEAAELMSRGIGQQF
jgi:hypothetical protein